MYNITTLPGSCLYHHIHFQYAMYKMSIKVYVVISPISSAKDMKRLQKLYGSVEALCSGFWCHLLNQCNVIPEIRDIFPENPLAIHISCTYIVITVYCKFFEKKNILREESSEMCYRWCWITGYIKRIQFPMKMMNNHKKQQQRHIM